MAKEAIAVGARRSVHDEVCRASFRVARIPGPCDHRPGAGASLFVEVLLPWLASPGFGHRDIQSVLFLHPGHHALHLLPKLRLQCAEVAYHDARVGRRRHRPRFPSETRRFPSVPRRERPLRARPVGRDIFGIGRLSRRLGRRLGRRIGRRISRRIRPRRRLGFGPVLKASGIVRHALQQLAKRLNRPALRARVSALHQVACGIA
ncbi:MAG: hypothetical protein C0497_03060 [Gemmatimonas sp.]|nr:hypothetical protein [Gemmatimonas sp.]